MYAETEENRFLEVTYANGDKEVPYFKDFNSGAMIQNIVDRAKKMAIKDFPTTTSNRPAGLPPAPGVRRRVQGERGPPNTTNPDDWAGISGKKGERIVFIRTLITGKQGHRARPVDRHGLQHRSGTSEVTAAVGHQPQTERPKPAVGDQSVASRNQPDPLRRAR